MRVVAKRRHCEDNPACGCALIPGGIRAQMIPEWGETTFLLNDTATLEPEIRADLTARGVTIEATAIMRLEGAADVVLHDGRRLSFSGPFTAPRNTPSSRIAQKLGCELEETPFGNQIATNEAKQTNIAGAFACGDAARLPHSVTFAVADGAWAGAQFHRSLIWPDDRSGLCLHASGY